MPQNLGGIALPFTVLRIASFLCIDLPRGYQGLKLLGAAYNLRGRVLAKCQPLHHAEDILQHDRFGIDRCNQTLPHRLRYSCHLDALIVNILSGLPFAALERFIDARSVRHLPYGVVIVPGDRKANDLPDLHVAEFLRNAFLGYSYCLFHIFYL